MGIVDQRQEILARSMRSSRPGPEPPAGQPPPVPEKHRLYPK
ncbi:hypothetical protein I553_3479 [Mycobacterium xenopi 4042]|uniref:Uncharacterized protein n=1 Tax=Mycobacterium xenopi 4042 TaxID=1299334 RepID=X7ZY79_MYCXE|nr:hypothetical protein I553_3479 [Mycobacterium xenopi 4042]